MQRTSGLPFSIPAIRKTTFKDDIVTFFRIFLSNIKVKCIEAKQVHLQNAEPDCFISKQDIRKETEFYCGNITGMSQFCRRITYYTGVCVCRLVYLSKAA